MKLAIQGHSNRGNEVISYLERLGGKNPYGCNGLGTLCAYHIINGNIQIVTIEDLFNDEYILYSLEGILAKFPYKVGDKVIYEDKIRKITKMIWEEQTNTVAYKLDDKLYCNVINKLQPYKEEIMEEKENSVVVNIEHKLLKVHSLRFDKTQLVINDEYELKQEGDSYYIVCKKT